MNEQQRVEIALGFLEGWAKRRPASDGASRRMASELLVLVAGWDKKSRQTVEIRVYKALKLVKGNL